jgi:hypothetical protein
MVLTMGKKPRVKTLSRLVLPQAPSPMMTSFLEGRTCQQGRTGIRWGITERGAAPKQGRDQALPLPASWQAYLRMTFWALRSFAMVGKRTGER